MERNWKRERLGNLLNNIQKSESTDQSHESGILKHARTEENVTAVDELPQPGRPDTNTSFNTPDIQTDGSKASCG